MEEIFRDCVTGLLLIVGSAPPVAQRLPCGSVTVTGDNGCTNSTSATIIAQGSPAVPNVSTVSNSSCLAPYNGSITVNAPTGTNFTYSINGTEFQSSTVFSELSAGTYTVTVKNAAGCTSTKEVSVGSTGSTVTAQAQANNPCAGGDLILTGSASTADATFEWTGPNDFISENQNPTISNATANLEGVYTLTVTETATGCTSAANVSVIVIRAQIYDVPRNHIIISNIIFPYKG